MRFSINFFFCAPAKNPEMCASEKREKENDDNVKCKMYVYFGRLLGLKAP